MINTNKYIKKAFIYFESKIIQLGNKLYSTEAYKYSIKWNLANGDKTLRLNYDLDESSLVFDVGGYEGQWASDIYSKYLCTIYIFEPVMEYAQKIKTRFKNNNKIAVFNFGLANKNKELTICVNKDSSSLFKNYGKLQIAKCKKASEFIYSNSIGIIDIMKINIEGAEYELLEDLIMNDVIRKIINIQIQFHDFVKNAKSKMKILQNKLNATHRLTYQYPFVWENWKLK